MFVELSSDLQQQYLDIASVASSQKMIRINARGAILTSVIALILVLLFVAQWKRNEINAWRGPHADAASPPVHHEDTKLGDVAEFKDDVAAPAVPDYSAGNSTLGVRQQVPQHLRTMFG